MVDILDFFIDLLDENWHNTEVVFAESWSVPWLIEPGERDGYELNFLEKGTGIFTTGDRCYKMETGDLLIVNSMEGNSFTSEGQPFRMLCTTFNIKNSKNSDKINRANSLLKLEDFPWKLGEALGFSERIHKMNGLIASSRKNAGLMLKVCLIDLVLFIRESLENISLPGTYRKIGPSARLMADKIQMYICKNYSRKITIPELASLAAVSPQYLCSLFKKIMGKSIVDYINAYRIDRAKRLLLYTNLNITEIAIETGFCNSQYFNRIFIKLEKLTPGQFRKGKGTFGY